MSDDPTLRLTDFVRQNAIFQRLLEISLALNSTLALKPLLSEILTATCEIVDSEAASLLLYVTNADELRFVASNTPGENHEALLGTAVPVEGSVAGQIARENRPIIIQNADQDARIYRSVDIQLGFHTRSLLGVPMHVKGKVIGVLEALNKRSGLWTEEDARYATILASHAAVAIQNARQTEALRKAYAELDKLDKLKTDFIAIASHELRTPLSVILGYASFLKEDAQGEVSELASAVLNSALQLRSIIEDMTNLRFLHQGTLETHRENLSAAQVVRTALSELQALAQAKGQRLVLDLQQDAPICVDRAKIGMALVNVLNNAIKFTPQGGEIRISLEQRRREVWIRVADNGIGIPPDLLDKIFEEFFQAEDHMTRRHNGMGIGLSIARGMVEAHGGRIWAESGGIGRGSVFTIALPLAERAD
ncbi:MAG: ATP-binding protein [Aggregatilineales bacterium]